MAKKVFLDVKTCCSIKFFYVRETCVYYDKLIKLRNINTAIFVISDMTVLEMMLTIKKKLLLSI